MTQITLKVPKESEMHKFLVSKLTTRLKMAETTATERHKKWQEAEERILAYLPETELDARRRRRREQGRPAYTTIQIPYSYALLMSAHTYWTSVFFARQPVHQYMGRHGESEQQIQALEALIDYQAQVAQMLGPYYIWLYDGGKYGLGVLGHYWDRKITQYSTIQADPEGGKIQTTQRVTKYEGNCVYNISPFDFYPDPRVPVGRFQTGEYCAVKKRVSWDEVLLRKTQGYYTNIEHISTTTGMTDRQAAAYSALIRPGERLYMSEDNQTHPAFVEVYEVYVSLVQKEWRLGGVADFPEKWVFTITADKSLILGVQPLGMIHGEFPIDVFEPEIEGYGQWNRGIPEIAEPVQNTMDWLINSHFFNVRAALNNLFLADPTKVVMKDFENSEPGGIIRIKPEAIGQPLESFFKQIPIGDVTQSHLADVNVMQAIGERMFGINDQIMGALAGTGRKTATEVRTTTGFGVNRQKTITEYASATAFSPHSQKLVQNSQQFFDATKKLRIVGDLSKEAGVRFIDVNPESIAGFYDFVPVDGTFPIDRFAQVNLWAQLLSQAFRIPQVAARYDLGRIFGWVAVLGGIKNLRQFELQPMQAQIGSDESLAREAERGNVIPLSGRTMSDTRMTGVSEPGMEQMSGY